MASRSWNRVELIGNLTRDPELRFTPNGAAVCTFGVATNRTYVSEGEKKEEVDFHKLVAWNKLAELCNQLLKKGNRVFISGRLQTRSWEGQDGQVRQTTEIVIEDMILLTPKTVTDEVIVPEELTTTEVTKPKETIPQPEVKEEPQKVEASVAEQAADEAKEDKGGDKKKVATKDETPPQEEVDDLPF